MNVVVDALALGSQRGGDETFLRGVLQGLATSAGSDNRFTLLMTADADVPSVVEESSNFERRLVPRRAGAWHFGVTLPCALSSWRATSGRDLVFTITHAPAWTPIPNVLTVGDLSFLHHPEFYPRATRTRLRTLVPRHVRRARVVVTPSEFSRGDLIETLHLPEHRVFVVPNAVEPEPAFTDSVRAAVRDELRTAGVSDRFFLYVGNLHPRKNVARLLRAFALARTLDEDVAACQLVVAGARWWGAEAERDALAHAPGGSVVVLGRVSATWRQYLLESAVALAYPSLFEGFGLPPVEAMAVGTPALVSDRAALPEVTGNAALVVDPLDVEAIADGLVRLATDEHLRTELRIRGYRQVRRYTHRAVGNAAEAAFNAALGS